MYESPSSVNSFELMNDIQQKLSQSQQPFTLKLQLARSKNIDQVDYQEQIEFLQFKQQLFLKRLIELRANHDSFLQDLPNIQQTLIQAIKNKINQISEQSQQVLKDQEKLINDYLKEIQLALDTLQNNYTQSNYQLTTIKKVTNKFPQIAEKLKAFTKEIANYNVFTIEVKQFSQEKIQLSKKSTPIKLESSVKKFSPCKTAVRNLDDILKNLEKKSSVSPLRMRQKQIQSPSKIYDSLTKQKNRFLDKKGKK